MCWEDLLLPDKPYIRKYYSKLLNKDSFKAAIDEATHSILQKGIADLKQILTTQSSIKEIHTQLRRELYEL